MKLFKTMSVALATLAVAAPATWSIAQDDDAVFDTVIDSTVRIRVDGSSNSNTGWMIEPIDAANRAGAAVVVTSYNKVEGAQKIVVYSPTTGNTEYPATLLAKDLDRDLAFLEVKDLPGKPIAISGDAHKVGRRVWALGYNREADETEGKLAANATLKSGSLSRVTQGPISTEAHAPVNQLEHDVAMLPGFEGGPLLDRCANVIGMNVKSGGEVVERADLHIESDSATMDALKGDEIIKAANQDGVKYTPASDSCGGASTPPMPGPSASPGASPTAGPAATATGTTASEGFSGLLHSTPFLVVLGLLGVVAAAFGLYTMTRRDDRPEDFAPAEPAGVSRRAPSRPAEDGVTTLLPDTKPLGGPTRTLRLSGRGPDGEAIDLSFSSDDLAARQQTLGVGTNADVRFPDNRAEYLVSRVHARLGFDGRSFTLEDNKSLNHTFVDGRQLEPNVPTALVNGDVIALADVELRVAID